MTSPLDFANALATIVNLTILFMEEKSPKGKKDIDQFKEWLKNSNNEHYAKIISNNESLCSTIDFTLKNNHSETSSLLNEMLEILKANRSTTIDTPNSKIDIEKSTIISLGDNNAFTATPEDLRKIALECAINTINCTKTSIKIHLTPTNLGNNTIDPLDLAKYESARNELANNLKKRLEILTSPITYKYWHTYLSKVEEWEFAIYSLIKRSEFAYINRPYGIKIDVWRTEAPCLSAPIYLNDDELSKALTHLNFKSTKELAFGAGWRDLSDLPNEIISKHALPSIITQIVRSQTDINKDKDVLDITSWHIGEG